MEFVCPPLVSELRFRWLHRNIWWFILSMSSAGIMLFSMAGDSLVSKWDQFCVNLSIDSNTTKIITKALTDNLVHAVIAGWSWLNVNLLQGHKWSQVLLWQTLACNALGSLIDIDHFIAAGSIHIQEALNIHHRPFLHNTSLILTLTAFLFSLVYLTSYFRTLPKLYTIPALFFTACLSHHLRDATRRGVWFAPFGSLPPHKIYVVGLVFLPVVVAVAQRQMKVFTSHTSDAVLPT